MAEVHAATWIAAPPEHVWQVLADLPGYPRWNPFIIEAAGSLYEGERLRLRVQPLRARTITLRPLVRWVEPAQELRWRLSLPVPGLLSGEHVFHLQPLGRGTHFVQRGRFTGALVPLLASRFAEGVQPALEAMNAALRTYAEQTTPPAADPREPHWDHPVPWEDAPPADPASPAATPPSGMA